MKYGVVVCKNTDNIGDDVQSYAAKCFLPSVDYVIDREGLDTFQSEQGETVKAIMNGWYMYSKFNWPPVSCIDPLWVAMHISKNDYFGIGDRFLDGMGGEYLRHYGLIGARDESTMKMLRDKEIPCYQSGCLTLTLPKMGDINKTDEVLLVDVDKNNEETIRVQYPNETFVNITHKVDTTTYHALPVNQRFARVEMLLQRYQNAKCVVTSRLHCALPCLALKTPVLLIYKQEYASRIQSFLPLLHYCNFEDLKTFIQSDFDISNPPDNNTKYLEIRQQLSDVCKAFVSDESVHEPFKVSLQEIHCWQKKLLEKAEYTFRNELNKQGDWIKSLTNDREFFREQSKEKQERVEELQGWIEQLEEAKNYLEKQNNNKDIRITELENWCKEVTNGKDYVEAQWKQTQHQRDEMQRKLEMLLEDDKIRKIIRKKGYEI